MSHNVLLWKMKFGHRLGDKGFVDNLEVSGGSIEEAGCGDIVDLSWDAACVVMDDGFGFRFKDLFIASGRTHPGVDVGGSLVFGEGKQVASDRYSVDKICQGGTGKDLCEGLLAAEDDLYGKVRIHCGPHKEA